MSANDYQRKKGPLPVVDSRNLGFPSDQHYDLTSPSYGENRSAVYRVQVSLADCRMVFLRLIVRSFVRE